MLQHAPTTKRDALRPDRAAPNWAAPVAPPENTHQLDLEIDRLPLDRTLIRAGGFKTVWARATEIPAVLREIGRLREISFRQVGEGTLARYRESQATATTPTCRRKTDGDAPLEDLFFLQQQDDGDSQTNRSDCDQQEGSFLPLKGKRNVHAVRAGDERGNHEDDRKRRQDFHHLVQVV